MFRTDRAPNFMCMAQFPVVMTGRDKQVTTFKLYYTSEKPPQQKTMSIFPMNGNSSGSWFIETLLTQDKNSQISVLSSLSAAGATENSYLYSDMPDNFSLGGASLGLAVFMVVQNLGNSPLLVFTGMISCFGQERESGKILEIDNINNKITYCSKRGKILFFPFGDACEVKQLSDQLYFTRTIYTFDDYQKGIPYTASHIGVACASNAECMCMAQWLGNLRR